LATDDPDGAAITPTEDVSNELTGTVENLVQAGTIVGGVQINQPSTSLNRGQLDAVSVAPPLGRRDPHRPLRGRDRLIESLVQLFARQNAKSRVHILHGLSGVGKTSIALELCFQALQQGVRVWWVSGVDGTGLVAGMHAIARQIGATNEQLSHGDAADVLWRYLASWDQRWLIVVDNANNVDLLAGAAENLADGNGWIRPFENELGLVVVTSREGDAAIWGIWCHLHQIGSLDNLSAAQVLLDYTRGQAGSLANAIELAERLGGLPLALCLAGTYLADTSQIPWPDREIVSTFTSYKAAIDQGRLITELSGQQIGRTWELSLDLLDGRGLRGSRVLLSLLSILAEAAVPYQLLLNPVILAKSGLFPSLDGTQLWRLLQGLANLSLIDLATYDARSDASDGVRLLRIHPLVRDIIRHHPDTIRQIKVLLITVVALLDRAVETKNVQHPKDPSTWPAWITIAPHAFQMIRALTKTTDLPAIVIEQASRIGNMAAVYIRAQGLYEQAEAEYRTMLSTCQQLVGDDHQVALTIRYRLAIILHDRGNYEAAEAEQRAVLAVRNRVLGALHPDTLDTRNSVAHMLQHLGMYDVAAVEHRAVLEMERQLLGDDHNYTRTARQDLAQALHALGQYRDAEAQYRVVLESNLRILSNDHPDTLVTRYHFASALHDLGQYDAAEAEYRIVLDAESRILGDEHPDTLETRYQVAHMLRHCGANEASESERQAVLQLMKKVLGDDHPTVMKFQAPSQCFQ